MPGEILIHVGAGKTGTSALQQFFLLNQRRLRDFGLTVPSIGTDENQNYLAHHKLTGAGRFRDVDPFPYWREIAKIRAKKVLVSSEIFHSRMSHKDGVSFYREVLQILSGWSIRIVFYIRREDQWIQSAYEQWIKTGELRSGETVQELAERPRKGQASQVLEFARLFGSDSLIVRPYERSQLWKGDVIDDFFESIGTPIDDHFVRPAKNPNPSLPAELLNFKRIFNSVCADRKEAQVINAALNELAATFDNEHSRSFVNRQALSAKRQAAILEAQKDDYEWIAKNILGRNDGVLFEAPADSDSGEVPTDFEEGRNAEHTRVLAFLIKKLYLRNESLERRIARLEKK